MFLGIISKFKIGIDYTNIITLIGTITNAILAGWINVVIMDFVMINLRSGRNGLAIKEIGIREVFNFKCLKFFLIYPNLLVTFLRPFLTE